MKILLLALLLVAPVCASAQPAAPVATTPAATTDAASATPDSATRPQGQLVSAVAVKDTVFGVHAKVLGLERSVEMLQWRKVDFPAPPHYEQAWLAGRVDATGFDAAHANSGDLPFNGERWWSDDPKLDGHPVSADVLATLVGWTPLKPDLAQLPTNLAVSFQPDGDWLSTSQDPAHPQVGDVRVRWRSIEHAAAPTATVLVAGRWELPAPVEAVASPTAATLPTAGTTPVGDMRAWAQRVFGDHLAWLIVAGFALALILLVRKRRR